MGKSIFVFGSNLAGRHGAGAAKYAVDNHGAVYGIGRGLQNSCYAIPTKDWAIQTLPLTEIKKSVDEFIEFAKMHSELLFDITRIGCGLAGYTDNQIAPMFKNAPLNCRMPEEWAEFLGDKN
jgi:hypothetical protein